MKVINSAGDTIAEATTRKGLASRFVDSYRIWAAQVSEEEVKAAGVRALDNKGQDIPLQELFNLFDSEMEKAAAGKSTFRAPHLQGCNTPHRVRKPWQRW